MEFLIYFNLNLYSKPQTIYTCHYKNELLKKNIIIDYWNF